MGGGCAVLGGLCVLFLGVGRLGFRVGMRWSIDWYRGLGVGWCWGLGGVVVGVEQVVGWWATIWGGVGCVGGLS